MSESELLHAARQLRADAADTSEEPEYIEFCEAIADLLEAIDSADPSDLPPGLSEGAKRASISITNVLATLT